MLLNSTDTAIGLGGMCSCVRAEEIVNYYSDNTEYALFYSCYVSIIKY